QLRLLSAIPVYSVILRLMEDRFLIMALLLLPVVAFSITSRFSMVVPCTITLRAPFLRIPTAYWQTISLLIAVAVECLIMVHCPPSPIVRFAVITLLLVAPYITGLLLLPI